MLWKQYQNVYVNICKKITINEYIMEILRQFLHHLKIKIIGIRRRKKIQQMISSKTPTILMNLINIFKIVSSTLNNNKIEEK